MDILNQLRMVYQSLERMKVNGGENVECLYGAFYGLTQVINQLQQQAQEVEEIKEEIVKEPTEEQRV